MNGGDSSKNMNGSLRQNALFIKKKKKRKKILGVFEIILQYRALQFFF